MSPEREGEKSLCRRSGASGTSPAGGEGGREA